jgi:ABC-2 type transport system permease protein
MNAQALTTSFPMLIRREFWEHRVLWLTPLALAALFVAGCVVLGGSSLHSVEMSGLPRTGSPSNGTFLFVLIQLMFTGILFALMSVVIFFYLTDCLYAERKDRSILFWKSLPVSDTATVLSKLVVALLVVPLGVYIVAAVANILAFAVLSLWVRGTPFLQQFLRWDTGIWLRLNGLLIVDVLIITLWYAPVAAYQLLISAWARSNVFVWTILPPLALSLGEYAAFRTWHIGKLILGWLMFTPPGGRVHNSVAMGASKPEGAEALLNGANALPLLMTPALWAGLVVAALLVFVTIRVRRHRDET